MSKGQAWDLDVLDVYVLFEGNIYRSSTGMHAFRTLAQHQAVDFAAAMTEIRAWAGKRRSGVVGHNSRLDKKASFTPWDIQQALRTLCTQQGCLLCKRAVAHWAPGGRRKTGNDGNAQGAGDHGQGEDAGDCGQDEDTGDCGQDEDTGAHDGQEDGQEEDGHDNGQEEDVREDGQEEDGHDNGQEEDGHEDGQEADGHEDGQEEDGHEDGQEEDAHEDGQERPTEQGRSRPTFPQDNDVPTPSRSPARSICLEDDLGWPGFGQVFTPWDPTFPTMSPNPSPSRLLRQASTASSPPSSSPQSSLYDRHHRPLRPIRSAMTHREEPQAKRQRLDVDPANTPSFDATGFLAAFLPNATFATSGVVGRISDEVFIYIVNLALPASSSPTDPTDSWATDSWAVFVGRPKTTEAVVYAANSTSAQAAFDRVQKEYPTPTYPNFTSALFTAEIPIKHTQSSQVVAHILGVVTAFDDKIPPSLSPDVWATLFSMSTLNTTSLDLLLRLPVHAPESDVGILPTKAALARACRNCELYSQQLKTLNIDNENAKFLYRVADKSLEMVQSNTETGATAISASKRALQDAIAHNNEVAAQLEARQRTADILTRFKDLLSGIAWGAAADRMRTKVREQLDESKSIVDTLLKKLSEEVKEL
ncbi:unnamed protein product [Zymoseptoria tritici ST99CH_1A5]|uniref:Uncharacterized protein n=1 Tax=Zymoseptoria tritici ST99CH_1A5 TaxID=1276529 RepID=A0A1Y6M0U1_ZYMTR|nr:unnamed protein product [Zymoseptoria tritici ST99CH_1A5]